MGLNKERLSKGECQTQATLCVSQCCKRMEVDLRRKGDELIRQNPKLRQEGILAFTESLVDGIDSLASRLEGKAKELRLEAQALQKMERAAGSAANLIDLEVLQIEHEKLLKTVKEKHKDLTAQKLATEKAVKALQKQQQGTAVLQDRSSQLELQISKKQAMLERLARENVKLDEKQQMTTEKDLAHRKLLLSAPTISEYMTRTSLARHTKKHTLD